MFMLYPGMAKLNFGWNLKSNLPIIASIQKNNSTISKHLWRSIMMNSLAHGDNTFPVEITHISSHGVWLLTDQEELFMSYQDFPWFKNQPVNAIIEVEEVSRGHFYWSKIDVDLTVEMIKHPETFPLVATQHKQQIYEESP